MKLILRLIWQQAKRHPWRTALTCVLILIVAGLWVGEPLYLRYAINEFMASAQGKPVDFVWLFAGWAALFFSLSLFQSLEKYFSWDLDNLTVLEQREDVYAHVLNLDIAFHTNQKGGEVIKELDEGADTLMEVQRNLFVEFLPSLLAAIVFLVIGFYLEPTLALILIVALVLYASIVVTGVKKTVELQRKVNKLWVEAIARSYDAVTNIFSVKSGAQERTEMLRMRASHDKSIDSQRKVNYRWALVEAVNFFMLTRIILSAAGILLFVKGKITLGDVYFFQGSFFRVLTPFEMLSGILPQWNKRLERIKAAERLRNTPIRVANKPDAVILPALKGEIALQGMCFAYGKRETPLRSEPEAPPFDEGHPQEYPEEPKDISPLNVAGDEPQGTEPAPDPSQEDEEAHAGDVLHDIHLTIRAGEHIAFVGHSGAGKSTLAMLLNRFYDVTKGRILVDGIDLRDLDVHWWRAQVGLVLQDNIMFNDSILENIRYARPSATEEEVREAARRAAAAEFIESLPEGYRTLIGDRGIKLSGGQRQRVAIARAILKKPRIVVLDEATSALDSVTERHVQEGIKGLIEGRTSCIIAHRLSTVRSVDRIAVFDKGRLIDVAPHEVLLKRCAIYREMVELQSQGMLAE